MEGFYDYDSQFVENRFPTAMDLKEIKQMLMSGEKQNVLQAVEKVKTFLNSEESLSEVLMYDISEFVCDAVIPSDSDMVCTLYSCLELMTGHVEFFTYNHACFAVDSIMRTLHFVMKGSSNFFCLNQCLNVLNLIMQGYNTHNVSPETKTVQNLLHLLPVLQKNLSPTINNKYHIGALILSLTELDTIKLSQEACEIILTSFSSWFSLLIETLELEHPFREKLILLTSTLCHSTLRYLISNKSSSEELEIDENLKNDLIKNISEFLISVGTPFFDSVSLLDIESDPSHLENFYQAILYFYGDSITSEKNQLTHGLSEMGFLQLTTKIISTADFSQGHKLRRLCTLVLFHVILCLSEDVFNFPEVWPSGVDDFRNEVQQGIAQLPVEATKWLDVLVTPQTSLSCKLALLLYLYFYSMTARSQDTLQAIYPAVVSFIQVTRDIESSPLLLKIVWFVFVISQLSFLQSSSVEVEDTNEMVSLLESRGDLSLVYTHHPALLYWAFSSKVSSSIQTQTVHLWLRNKTPDCKELDQLMRNSSDVRFAILDILRNGWGEELDLAVSSLKSLLMDSDDDDDLAASVWFLLPQVLAKFTADSTSVMNVDYVIELCSLRFPQNLDVSRIIRIASLLPEVLLKSDLLSIVPSLSLTLQLMQAGLEMNDDRVLCVFLRHEKFILKIVEGLNANVSQVSLLSIRIIILLWKESGDIKNAEKRRKIGIRRETILKLLEADCEQVLSAGLEFLQKILLTRFQSPIFNIADVDADFVEVLFLEMQNVCVKVVKTRLNISKHCWHCFRLFLTVFSDRKSVFGESVQGELMSNPLLHELVLLHLPHLNESREMKQFLTVWLELYNSKTNDPCFGRKIFGKFYSETVQRIGRKLADDFKEEEEEEDRVLLEKVIESGFWCENP